jgi:hypothetical protein
MLFRVGVGVSKDCILVAKKLPELRITVQEFWIAAKMVP